MARRQKWKDKLRPAKFRGVQFYVDSSTYGSGRRGVTHEFPGRNIPFREDLGRKAKTYPVEGYVLGSDYRSMRDKLITACEKEGSGELVHPYYGKVIVCCEDLSVTETSGEGGTCKFTLKFVEAGSIAFPTSLLDTGFLVGAAADLLGADAITAFEDTLSIVGQATEAVTAAAEKVNDFADLVENGASGITGTAADIANLAFAIRDLKANARDLLGTPGALAAQMDGALNLLVKASNPADVFRAAKDMFGAGDTDVLITRTTSRKKQQALNLESLNTLTQMLSLTKASVAATDIDYASAEDATAARDALIDHIDKLSLANSVQASLDDTSSTAKDEVYNSLQNLRAQIVRAVPAPGQELARIAEYTIVGTTSILALVYDRYGSLDLEDDVINRNGIVHPGFIKGGTVLEVLDSGV